MFNFYKNAINNCKTENQKLNTIIGFSRCKNISNEQYTQLIGMAK